MRETTEVRDAAGAERLAARRGVASSIDRRFTGDRGAVVVEAAFMSPIFIFLLLGVVEVGLLMRNWLAMSAGTQDGARTASILGNTATADYEIIQAAKKSLQFIPREQIRNLVVWRATGPDDQVPDACVGASTRTQIPALSCNVYVPNTDWDALQSEAVDYNCTAPGYSRGYCPTTRKVAATNVDGEGPPDYVGITFTLDHAYVSGLFGNTKTLVTSTITRLEPKTLS